MKGFIQKQPNWLVRLIVEGVILYLVEHVDAFFNGLAKLLKNIHWQTLLLLFSSLLSYLANPTGFIIFFSPLVFLMCFLIFLGSMPYKWTENNKWSGKLYRLGVKAGLLEPVNGTGINVTFTEL